MTSIRSQIALVALLLAGCGVSASHSDEVFRQQAQPNGDVFTFIDENGKRIELPLTYALRIQSAESRKVDHVEFESIRVIGTPGAEDPIFWYAIRLDVDGDGTIYVLDQGRRDVLAFEATDTLGRRLLRGRGEGPGELTDPFLLSVSLKGDVFVADPGTRGFVFSEQGDILRMVPRSELLTVIALLQEDGRVVALHSQLKASGPMYSEHFPTETPPRAFGPFIADAGTAGPVSLLMAVEGFMRPLPDGGFLHVMRRAGQILRYDRNGDFVYAVGGIDAFDHRLPTLKREMSGSMVRFGLAEEGRHSAVHRDADVAGDFLFLLSTRPIANADGRMLDIYATADGSYCATLVVPQLEGMKSFRIRGDRVYTLHESGQAVHEWRAAKPISKLVTCG